MKRKEEIKEEFDSIFRAYLKKTNDSTEANLRTIAVLTEVLCDIRSNLVGIMKAINPQNSNRQSLQDVTEQEQVRFRE